ncbi:MAG: hypothetical protein KAG34_05830 [Cocleimonas sp.]|nr:hypothetical protein [Cocleimonas sp.]
MKIQIPITISTLLSISVLMTACGGGGGDGKTSITPPITSDTHSYASLVAANPAEPSRLDLLSGHTVTDNSWEVAYQKYIGWSVNGGHSGSGTVEGCIAHQYTVLFGADKKPVASEFEKLTKDSTAADFDAVTKTSCTEMLTDTLRTEIKTEDWLDADYSQGAPVYSAKTGDKNGWIIRSSKKNSATDAYNYARIKVKSVNISFAGAPSRKVILSVENWDAATSSFSAVVDSPGLNYSNGRVFYDMETNTVVTESDSWDLSINVNGRDYPIQTNGGASGNGSGGVGVLISANANAVTDPANTQQVYKYFGDSVEGILSKPGNYGPFQYSVKGQHKMWPTFTTYLFKDGTRFYKMQVISNYGETGTDASGNLYIRYEELN